MEERIGVASSLRLERELEPAGSRAVDVEGSVEIAEGTKHAVDASADAQEVIASLDSRLRLADVVDTTADRLGFDDEETEALREETIEVIRELLELGALQFRGD
jgi:phage tail sheath protein FI